MLPCTKEPADAHVLHMRIIFPFISPLSLLGVLHAVQLSLTPDNLMPLLQGVRNWWKCGELDDGLLCVLGVPESKQQEIREQCGSDEEKAVAKCIEWWLEHATNVSWREIVHRLYKAKETRVAYGIRQHAEPVQGSRKNTFYLIKSKGLSRVCECNNNEEGHCLVYVHEIISEPQLPQLYVQPLYLHIVYQYQCVQMGKYVSTQTLVIASQLNSHHILIELYYCISLE